MFGGFYGFSSESQILLEKVLMSDPLPESSETIQILWQTMKKGFVSQTELALWVLALFLGIGSSRLDFGSRAE